MTEPKTAAIKPLTGSRRIQWPELPERIRALIEARLGGDVVRAESQMGGFSPGMASKLYLPDGHSAFVKAVGPEQNVDSPIFYRREAAIAPHLPNEAPVPRFLWSLDEEDGGWVVLAFEAIEGRSPHLPWDKNDLALVIESAIALSDVLTPSPIGTDIVGRADETWAIACRPLWHLVAYDPPDGLDDWSRRNLDRLVSLEAGARDAVAGDTLLHIDMRADNLLISDGRVFVVDWPHAKVGAPWIDLAGMAPSVAMQGGPDPDDFLLSHPAARSADPEAINAFLAALASYFTYMSFQPDPPGIPTVRAFQRAQGVIARAWLAKRTGWT